MSLSTCRLQACFLLSYVVTLSSAEYPKTLLQLSGEVAHGDEKTSEAAVKQIGEMLTNMSSEALAAQLPELISSMDSADSLLHDRISGVLTSLSMLRPGDKLILQNAAAAMIRDLTDEKGQRQENAIVFLGRVKAPLPDSAVAVLLQLIDDRERLGVRSNAMLLLGDLASQGRRDALDALLYELHDPSHPGGRYSVLDAFGYGKLRDPVVISELIKALDNKDKFMIQSAARSLALIGGPDARAAVPTLRRIADDVQKDDLARSSAASALRQLEK